MHEVSIFRINLLRGMFLLIAVGLGIVVWPGVFLRSQSWLLSQGVIQCMLVAFSLLCAIGVRYPLQMLPIMLWELIWKTVWLSIVALPKFLDGSIDEKTMALVFELTVAVLIPFVIPWGYVMENYFTKPGTPWRSRALAVTQ